MVAQGFFKLLLVGLPLQGIDAVGQGVPFASRTGRSIRLPDAISFLRNFGGS
jgi:hypothetical protein